MAGARRHQRWISTRGSRAERPSPIVFALDYDSVEDAERVALHVRDAIGMVKVGLELFVSAGPRAVAIGKACGLPVFLDLKLHDIPRSLSSAPSDARGPSGRAS